MSTAHRIQSDIDELGDAVWLELSEGLDEPYVLRLRVRRPEGAAPLEPSAALGEAVAIETEREGATPRRIVGLVAGLEDAPERSREIVLRIVPALALLDLERTSRIFQGKSVPEILEAVLGEALGAYERSVVLDLTQAYEPREYCVQWQETNLAFAHRLMSEEGIAYAFDHSGDAEVMTLRDDNVSYPELAATDGSTVNFTELDLTARADTVPEVVHHFEPRLRMGRTGVVVRDHDWTGPQSLHAEDGEPDEQGRERSTYEHGLGVTLSIGSYDEGVRRYQQHDAARQAPLRLEADRARLQQFEGRSTITSLTPGQVIVLNGHPQGFDGTYLVTHVRHQSSVVLRSDELGLIHNAFICIPIDVEHRPQRRFAKPHITSAEVARVVGPSGEEIHTDPHGRIKVQFPWDRDGAGDEHASSWIRVAHRWAGSGFGTLYIPRIGMEVVVRYLHGDPDRPIVTGAVYNGDNLLPYPLPDDKTKSTIKSNSSVGGGGFNELRYEDKAGDEQIFLHAQRNLDEVVLANHTTTVGANQTNSVHNDQTQTIHEKQTEDVHANQEMTVDGKRDVTVLSGFDETVDGTETRSVTSGVTEIIIGGQKRDVTGAVKEFSLGKETRVVTGGLTETLDSNHTRGILGGANRVATGTFTHSATGAVKLETPAAINVIGGGSFSVTGPPSVTVQTPKIMRFSNDHTIQASTKIKSYALEKSIFTLVFGLAAIKVASYGSSMNLTVGKVGVSRQAITAAGFYFSWGALQYKTGDSLQISGLVLDKNSFRKKN